MAETDTAQAGSREPDNQDASRRMSPETREKVARFEDKLYQQALQEQRDALPDTSIHAGGGTAMDRVDSYYPKHDVPIYVGPEQADRPG